MIGQYYMTKEEAMKLALQDQEKEAVAARVRAREHEIDARAYHEKSDYHNSIAARLREALQGKDEQDANDINLSKLMKKENQ